MTPPSLQHTTGTEDHLIKEAIRLNSPDIDSAHVESLVEIIVRLNGCLSSKSEAAEALESEVRELRGSHEVATRERDDAHERITELEAEVAGLDRAIRTLSNP